MGERVQAGPIAYTVLQSEWKPSLADGGRAPAHRFLVLRVGISNSSGQQIAVPGFTLLAADGKTYQEMTEGAAALPNWLGMLRNLSPGQSQEGTVVFDAPVAAYKLVVSDGGEVDSEKHAHIEIPVDLG